ncbi:uncharacterized protein E6C27_scaffold270G001970 [Cucumis melo var. makuwa]|uniref:Uncharacterized protein n=1 Tax=Cucumis melo var. makuwa TaxID=1194695 RepID=A0A5A7T4D3_CUCMM|nr:uncharacterized protein E6C27_scaffold270G001970 [Cucumis melo var. makuwa]
MVSGDVSALLKKNLPEKCRNLGMFSLPCTIEDSDMNDSDEFILDKECEKTLSNEFTLPPQDNEIKLKVLLSHLKYVFLEDKNIVPILILRELSKEQEERLLETLKKNKQAI